MSMYFHNRIAALCLCSLYLYNSVEALFLCNSYVCVSLDLHQRSSSDPRSSNLISEVLVLVLVRPAGLSGTTSWCWRTKTVRTAEEPSTKKTSWTPVTSRSFIRTRSLQFRTRSSAPQPLVFTLLCGTCARTQTHALAQTVSRHCYVNAGIFVGQEWEATPTTMKK